MSTKAVSFAVGVFLALVIVALIMNTQPSGTQAETPASPLTFELNELRSIEVTTRAGQSHRIDRTDLGGWVMRTGSVEWPVALPQETDRSLRLISDLQPVGIADGESVIESGLANVTFTLADQVKRDVSFSPDTVGGNTIAIVDGKHPILIDWQAVSGFIDPPMPTWRDTSALPGFSAQDISRLTIQSDGRPITLARIDGAWGMQTPISARASEQAVREVVGLVTGVQIEEFLDGPLQPTRSEADVGYLSLIAERDRREVDTSGQVRVNTMRRELHIGAVSDLLGPARPARFASPDSKGSMVFLIPADTATSISTTPRSYLSLFAAGARPADVAMITIRTDEGESGFRRDLAEWTRLMPDGSRAATPTQPILDLLSFMTELPGEPQPAGTDDEVRTLARIELHDFQGDVIDRMTIGYTADGQLAVRTGSVLLLYPGQTPPELLELPPVGSLAPQTPRPQLDVPETMPSK